VLWGVSPQHNTGISLSGRARRRAPANRKLFVVSKEFDVFIGYLIGAGAMILAGIVEILLGVDAERRPLEQVAEPPSAEGTTAAVSEGGKQEASSRPGSEERRAG
jgi:hypothetical protein